MEKTNFLEETIKCLRAHGKKEEDVLWVGRGFWIDPNQQKYKTTWADFRSKADFYYDDGYGLEYIPLDLIIVGKDFWLERREYDGSEGWEIKIMPIEPAMVRELDLADAYETIRFQESLEALEAQWRNELRGGEWSSAECLL